MLIDTDVQYIGVVLISVSFSNTCVVCVYLCHRSRLCLTDCGITTQRSHPSFAATVLAVSKKLSAVDSTDFDGRF